MWRMWNWWWSIYQRMSKISEIVARWKSVENLLMGQSMRQPVTALPPPTVVSVSYCSDCRPDVWPRLPTAALLRAGGSEAEGKMDGTTWNVNKKLFDIESDRQDDEMHEMCLLPPVCRARVCICLTCRKPSLSLFVSMLGWRCAAGTGSHGLMEQNMNLTVGATSTHTSCFRMVPRSSSLRVQASGLEASWARIPPAK